MDSVALCCGSGARRNFPCRLSPTFAPGRTRPSRRRARVLEAGPGSPAQENIFMQADGTGLKVQGVRLTSLAQAPSRPPVLYGAFDVKLVWGVRCQATFPSSTSM